MLKPTPSKIAFEAGKGNTPEPTEFHLKTGSQGTFKAWLDSLDEKPKTRKAKRGAR